MNCKSARQLIPAHLDGELTSTRAELVSRHLSSCQTCRDEAASLRRSMDALGALPGMEPAFTLADIRERAARRGRWNPLSALFPPVSRLAATALAIAAIGAGGASGVYYGSHSGAPNPPPVAASSESVSSSFGLDAFDDGLAGALHVAHAGALTEGQVTQ